MPCRRVPLLLILALPALGQNDDPFAPVLAEVEKIHREDGLQNASLGFALMAIEGEPRERQAKEGAEESGEAPAENDAEPPVIAGYRLDTALMPASTLKVVTTATALELLGPDFRFVTRLQHTGEIAEDGTLEGDLVIAGGGDPTLGATEREAGEAFKTWQTALEERGIGKIAGRVIGDDSLFGTQLRPDSWQWNDLGNYYAAGACGLTFQQNQYYCRFRTGMPGERAEFLGTVPKLTELSFVNEMRVGPEGSGDQGYVYGAPYGETLYLRGTVPAGGKHFTIRGALPDPALFCARSFSRYLERNGIEVGKSPATARTLAIAGQVIGNRQELLEQRSDPLAELIAVTNFRSDNLYAECLHRIIGVVTNEDGTTGAASQAVAAHWQEEGIDLNGFQMADGCGLSRANSITPRQMVLMLEAMSKSENFETFFASLPVAAESGTLRHLGQGTPSAGRVHAKSGSFERVKTYCGYLDAESGERYAFAIFVNHYSGDVDAVNDKILRVWNNIVAP